MKTVAIRVAEWTAWLPQTRDPHSPLNMSNGISFFEAADDEKLLEVAVTSAGQRRHIAMDVEGDKRNVPHALYAFQAVLARNVNPDLPVPEPVAPETEQPIILPGQNREERRKKS